MHMNIDRYVYIYIIHQIKKCIFLCKHVECNWISNHVLI